MLPSPTAEPTVAAIRPARDEKLDFANYTYRFNVISQQI